MAYPNDTTQDDGSGFAIGERVEVDNLYVNFFGTYEGMTGNGNARVRDEDTGDLLVGSYDHMTPAPRAIS